MTKLLTFTNWIAIVFFGYFTWMARHNEQGIFIFGNLMLMAIISQIFIHWDWLKAKYEQSKNDNGISLQEIEPVVPLEYV